MKVTYKTRCGRMEAEFEADTQTELWRQIGEFQEVFESALTCHKGGKKSDDIRFVVRTVDENDYYEARVASGALIGTKKHFGQTKKGNKLFPRIKDKDDNYLPDNGWVKYNKDSKKEE